MALRFNTIMRALLAGNTTPSVPSFYFNFSNPQNVTLGAAQARGNITSTQNAVIAASVSPSRTTGVAPLYVNFDATATTSTLITDADPVIQTARRNQELFYATDFGDSSAGVWANGVQSSGLTSKNAGYGPVTGHVYETPGTYTMQMVVTDGVNTVTKTGTIVVQDPNTVYAGALTICISHTGNFIDAPSGATQVNTAGNTDMYAAFNTYKGSNKRILFCKADSWTCSAQMAFSNITNMTVGGYGTGVAATFGSGTMVSVSSSYNGSLVYPGVGCTDIKFCNLRITASKDTQAVGLYSTITQFLAYKIEIRGCQQGFNAFPGTAGSNNVFDQHCMYECLVDDLYGYAFVDTPRANVTTTNGVADIAATAHPYVVGMMVHFPTSGEGTTQFPSTGTFPTPFAVTTTYFISSAGFAAGTFRLAPTLADAIAGTNTTTPTASGTYPLFSNILGGGIGAFVGLVRGGMMGCYLDSCNHGEQTLRLPFLDRAHINNSYFARPNQGKNVVKIHSFMYHEAPLYSEKFVFSGNEIDMRGGYSNGGYTTDPASVVTATGVGDISVIVGNGGNPGNERVRNGIFENNISRACEGFPRGRLVFIGISCPSITVRNNIADFAIGDRTSAYTSGYGNTSLSMALINSSTPDPTVNVNLYNNTLYSNMVNAETHTFVYFTGIGTGVTSTWDSGTTGSVFTSWLPDLVTPLKHGFFNSFRVRVMGTPPAGLTNGTFYYVTPTNLGNYTFTLSATLGGSPITLTDTGSCTVNQFVDVDGVNIKNNIWYNPHHNLVNPYSGVSRNIGTPTAAPTNVTTNHNTSDNGGIATDPVFAASPPAMLTDWRTTAPWTIDSGATVPVLSDFNQATRVGGTYDLGAVLP